MPLPLVAFRTLALLLGLMLASSAAAQLVWIPTAVLTLTPDAAVVRVGEEEAVYVNGLGWLGALSGPPPRPDGAGVWVPTSVAEVLARSRSEAPTGVIVGLRSAGLQEVRFVLDINGSDSESLRPLAAVGRVGEGERLQFIVPALLGEATKPAVVGPFEVTFAPSSAGTLVSIGGGAFSYDLFALSEPSRLVIDLRPDTGGIGFAEQVRELAPGVTYRTLRAPTARGASRVHVLEVAAGSGVWSVRALAGERRPTLAWAESGLLAINGGYFDAGSSAAIGLLVVDGEWWSPPSRGRAAVAFGPQGVVIDRVQSRTAVTVEARLAVPMSDPLSAEIAVHRLGGTLSGSASLGVLVLDRAGIVLENRAGPAFVPEGGVVVAYPPQLRALALVEPGMQVETATSLNPPALEGALYAVEAGPLLVKNGQPDFAPEREGFARGVRILDEVTQQAAIGVTADGTVLLVAAETMVASDLVPLMIALGAVDAMRLDSGGSTTLVAEGQVLNRTIERSVVNAIVFERLGER
jgi:uncharacterized protein YigE (DUF2233 family)